MLKTLITNNKDTRIKTKLIIFKSLIKPCGLQLWENAKKSIVNKIQTFQNTALRKMFNVPPYISNLTLHSDLKLKTVHDEEVIFYKRFHSKPLLTPILLYLI